MGISSGCDRISVDYMYERVEFLKLIYLIHRENVANSLMVLITTLRCKIGCFCYFESNKE